MFKLACLVPTYSIVAYDFDTGELGVAVQCRYFSLGLLFHVLRLALELFHPIFCKRFLWSKRA